MKPKTELEYYRENMAYYKGKCEVYERLLMAFGIIKPLEIIRFDKPSKK